jgi:hypothetical protein
VCVCVCVVSRGDHRGPGSERADQTEY